MTTRELAESVRKHVLGIPLEDGERERRVDQQANETSAAGGDFIDSCDGYEAFAFVAFVGEREFYVTVEDVTPRAD